ATFGRWPGSSSQCETKRAAARIGPTVCEDEGPIPILNRSKRLTAMARVPCDCRLFYARPGRLARYLNAMRLTLIQRDDCQLCDEAWDVLAAAGVPDFDPLWIDGDIGLEARYRTRIPVLRREDSGAELDWPFDAGTVQGFLA